jgi:hypothetical protein
MVLPGEVDELEVEREGPQHIALALRRQCSDRLREASLSCDRPATPRAARKLTDPLLIAEQPGAALLN